MTRKLNSLYRWLKEKGLPGEEIPYFIDDVIQFFDKQGYLSLNSLNEELEDLGWGVQLIDETAYKQMMYFHRHENYWI
jgi:hypothetical protein